MFNRAVVQSVNRPTRASFYLAFSARQKKKKKIQITAPHTPKCRARFEKVKKSKKINRESEKERRKRNGVKKGRKGNPSKSRAQKKRE